MKLQPLLFAFFFAVISAPVTAQTKIGYVSVDEIFAAMPEVKKADSSLAAFQQVFLDSYQEQQKELDELLARFVLDSSKMTPAVKEAKRTDLQTRIFQLQNRDQELNKGLEAQKEKLSGPLKMKVIEAIKSTAKENGYNHVFNMETVIVYPEADDITLLVKKKLGIR